MYQRIDLHVMHMDVYVCNIVYIYTYFLLYYIILYYIMLCYVMLCYIVLYILLYCITYIYIYIYSFMCVCVCVCMWVIDCLSIYRLTYMGVLHM